MTSDAIVRTAWTIQHAEAAEMSARRSSGLSNRKDCRPKFVRRFYRMERTANEGFIDPQLRLYTPFIDIGKHDIVSRGVALGVPYEKTWSCYEGGLTHCGRCGTCVERKEAFRLAGVVDPTVYEDPIFEIEAFRG